MKKYVSESKYLGFKAKTAKTIFQLNIKAPVEKVFPLCCPVEEYRWIPEWKFVHIHCPNNKVELGTVFAEISSAPFLQGNFKGKTIWIAVLHDPEKFKLHFKLYNKNSRSLYKIELKDDGMGGTIGTLDFTYTAMNKKGNKLVDRSLEEKIRIMLSIIHSMLKHYCETGEMMTSTAVQKEILSEKELSVMDKIHMGLNRIAVSKMKDNDRERFMKKFHGAKYI